jgi:hypothetical protein
MVAMVRDFAQAKGFIEPPGYRRHRPESTLLYELVAEHYVERSCRDWCSGLLNGSAARSNARG